MKARSAWLLNGGFALAMLLFAGIMWFNQACSDEARTHLFGITIITHANRQVVIRYPSNQLAFFSFAQRTSFDPYEYLCGIYIFAWVCWRIIQSVQKPNKALRGFDVSQ
jgi:hypothetical protein